MSSYRWSIAMGAALAALSLCPASAFAADYCVDRDGCDPTSTFGVGGLQAALDAAAAASGSDRVLVGAGVYGGAFSYLAPDPVSIVGVGIGQTALAGTVGGRDALLLRSRASSVIDMSITAAASGARGLTLDGTARRLALSSAPGAQGTRPLTLSSGADVREVSVVQADPASGAVFAEGSATFTDSTISGGSEAVGFSGAGTVLTLSRLEMRSGRGVSGDSGRASVSDSLIDLGSTPNGVGLLAATGPGSVAIDASRVTIAGAGAGGQTGLRALAGSAPGRDASIALRDSVIAGPPVPIHRFATSGTANVSTDWSNYSSAGVVDAGAGSLIESNHGLSAPTFVAPAAGDYRPRFDSSLIDAGDPLLIRGVIDLLRFPRPVDGNGDSAVRGDPGAYEYQRAPPSAAAAAPPPATAGVAHQFSGSGVDPDGDPLAFSWSFGDGASGTGPTPVHSYSAAGTYTATLTVTDPTGRAASVSVTVVVSAAPAPAPTPTPTPTPGPTPPGSGGPATPGGPSAPGSPSLPGTPAPPGEPPAPPAKPVVGDPAAPDGRARDREAPVLSALRVARRGRVASFRLSEAATVELVFTRRASGRVLRRRIVISAAAGRVSVRLTRGPKALSGRFVLAVIATDSAGNASKAARVKFRAPRRA